MPEIARWLTGLGVAVPPGTGRLPTRADVRRAVDSLPAAKVERIETELEEATLIHAYGESASLYVSLSRPGGVYFERFPCEIVAPVMEALVAACGPLVLFGGYHKPVVVTPDPDSIARIRAGRY